MSDAFSSSHPASPARRRWPVALAVLLAFAAGLAVAGWGMTRWPLALRRPDVVMPSARPVAASKPAPAPSAVPAGPAPASPDPAMLAARTNLLAAQVASVEARTATVATDAAAASGQAGRAEAMLLAAAARRAVDRGTGVAGLEAPLRQRFGGTQPRATQTVLAALHAPVTLESLHDGLDALGDTLVSGTGDWWTRWRAQLAMLVVVHRAGTLSPVPAERLARARRLVDAGAVEPALTEVSQLPGAAAAVDWITAARRYVTAQRALDQLDAAAIRGDAIPVAAPIG